MFVTLKKSRPAPGAAGTSENSRNIRRAALAGLIGTMLENFDFVIYGTASALVFGPLFFPTVSPIAALIAAFSAYAVGFLARPLGGMFFSHFGEKFGRKWVLVSTLFLMGGATFAIGCLPDYGSIGITAPILLVLCRFLQGFGAGAEMAGSATLLTEVAPTGRRGILASFVMVGAAFGSAFGFLAWVLVQQLPRDMLLSWGWRSVFWSSVLVTITAAIIRAKMAESHVFEGLKTQIDVKHRAPLRVAAQHGWRNILRVIIMNWGVSTQSYVYQVFVLAYLTTVIHMEKGFVTNMQLIASVCAAFAALLAGWLADRFGRRPMTLALCGILTITPFLALSGLSTGSMVIAAIVIIFGYMAAAQGITGVHMSYFPELFGGRYRYAGVTIGREFSAVIGGGVAPLLATALLAWFANSWIPVAMYMALTMLVSFIASWTAPETANRDLNTLTDAQPGEARPGATA